MSGGLFDFSASGILVLNCSLCSGLMLKVTFGCAAWYAAATCAQTPKSGWVLPLCHQLRVILVPALALEVDPAPLPLVPLLLVLLLHAAIVTAAATAIAMTA